MSERPKTVAFYTLGCKVNQYDTDAMREAFSDRDYRLVSFDESADVYVINTCTVTGRGDAKSRQAIRRASRLNPDAVIAVTGCYSQVSPESVCEIPGVDVVAGINQGAGIVDLVERARAEKVVATDRRYEWPAVARFEGRTRATLKIQEGCEQFCSYCIVPRARGGLRSRPLFDVIGQVRRLVDAGFKEIVLTGVHLGAYGKETGGPNLTQLIRELGRVQNLTRLRLSSLEPIDIDDQLFLALAQLDAFCPHLHLPLQSGSERVLRAMRRPYSPDEFAMLVDKARSAFPDIGISTDVIVGFPGETPEEFSESIAFVERMRFSRLHVFKFSARDGTPASLLKQRVDPKEMGRRSSEMIALGKRLSHQFHSRFVNKTLSVLAEEHVLGLLSGLSKNYIRVSFRGEQSLTNTICSVRLDSASDNGARGTLVRRTESS